METAECSPDEPPWTLKEALSLPFIYSTLSMFRYNTDHSLKTWAEAKLGQDFPHILLLNPVKIFFLLQPNETSVCTQRARDVQNITTH